jgi:hypothetical protein
LEELHQKQFQMERIRWEGQNFSEVVKPWEEEEEDSLISQNYFGNETLHVLDISSAHH